MLKKFSNGLAKYTNGWLIFVLFLVETAFMGVILPAAQKQMETGGGTPLDLMFFPTPEKIFSTLNQFSPAALAFYRTIELTADILYPITYTLFYSLLITALLRRTLTPENPVQLLNLLPFGAWLFDLLENISILSLIASLPAQPVGLASLLTLFNGIKWFFAGASILALLFSLITLLIKKIRR
jgi:hypothetical protein